MHPHFGVAEQPIMNYLEDAFEEANEVEWQVPAASRVGRIACEDLEAVVRPGGLD